MEDRCISVQILSAHFLQLVQGKELPVEHYDMSVVAAFNCANTCPLKLSITILLMVIFVLILMSATATKLGH